ncbi:MAG: hypothetical protein FWF84_07670, partial [Kiritimatiellaeota bacterium]|nr:hypothetical protein [Kiritimatiellota bacterium]
MKKNLCMAVAAVSVAGALAETVEIGAECAGMSAFRKFWDVPIVVAEDGERRVVDDTVKEWGLQAIWGGEGAGPLAFDAVNRMLLVRFPGAAEAIAEKLAQGFVIEKAEMALPYMDEELWPQGLEGGIPMDGDGYCYRMNWDCTRLYHEGRPNWHAVAYPLRKPWKADAAMGPTLNAAVNGAVYWKRFGASDVKEDRFDREFGPAEVSSYNNERMDVTAVLTDAAFGKDAGQRLRLVSDCGFVVSKWEVYDHRYYLGAYEFQTPTGYRAIVVKEPKLIVTFRSKVEGGKVEGKPLRPSTFHLPPPADIAAMYAKVKKGGKPHGTPTATLLSPKELAALDAKYKARPSWMPEWQYRNVMELMTLERGTVQPFYYQFVPGYYVQRLVEKVKREDPEREVTQEEIDYWTYLLWVDWMMCRPPRAWDGFQMSVEAIVTWYNYREALSGPVKDLFVKNWEAWLMPDRESYTTLPEMRNFDDVTGKLIHPQADDPRVGLNPEGVVATWEQGNVYYKKTGDWRGNKSFFRGGYTRCMSTQNFNYTSSSGALLLGQAIGSERAIADGRHGYLTFPFWLWSFGHGGVGQEYVDHYYWSLTMADSKLVPDYAEALQDRMVGWSILERNLEDLAAAYHPNVKKLVGPASRTISECILGRQEGLNFILHALSPKGALIMEDAKAGQLPLLWRGEGYQKVDSLGENFTPLSVARQSLVAPWTDPWMSELVDEKPLPWSLYALKGNSWVATYFGENYGLASIINTRTRLGSLAHWRRKAELPETMADVGTMEIRMGFNAPTRILNDEGGGSISHQGVYRNLQHKNTLITIAKPDMEVIAREAKGRTEGGVTYPEQAITSVQCSVGLYNFEQPAPTWDIYVDRQKIEALPATAHYGQVVTVKDGVTYVAIRPLGGSPQSPKGTEGTKGTEGPEDSEFSTASPRSPMFPTSLLSPVSLPV